MKLRLKGAQKGHSLLKKKADALTVRFRQILKKIIEVCLQICNSKVLVLPMFMDQCLWCMHFHLQ